MHLYLGHCTPYILMKLQPELTRVRLGFGIWRPVVAAVLVLAGNLAGITPVTL